MKEHIRLVGILNIVMGCLVAAIGVIVLMILGGVAGGLAISASEKTSDVATVAPLVALIGLVIAIFFLVLALPSIIGGWGLLNFKPWARVVMIVVSFLHLFHMPLGTALGVYGLWALLSEEGRRLFETGLPPTAVSYPAQPVPPVQ